MGIIYTTHMNRGKKRWRFQWKTGPEDKPKTAFTSTANRATEEGAAEMWAEAEAEIVAASSQYQAALKRVGELKAELEAAATKSKRELDSLKADSKRKLDKARQRNDEDHTAYRRELDGLKADLDAKTRQHLALNADHDSLKAKASAESARLEGQLIGKSDAVKDLATRLCNAEAEAGQDVWPALPALLAGGLVP